MLKTKYRNLALFKAPDFYNIFQQVAEIYIYGFLYSFALISGL